LKCFEVIYRKLDIPLVKQLGHPALPRGCAPVELDGANRLVDPALLLSDLHPGSRDDLGIEAKAGRDSKSVAVARDPDEQAIRGSQGLHIKLDTRVARFGMRVGKVLQLAVVGRRDDATPSL